MSRENPAHPTRFVNLRLAVGNVRKSWRDYMVYFVTLALGAAIFYSFNTIEAQVDMLPQQRTIVESLATIVFYLTWFLAAVLGFLMVYANNYLVRRRAKELALYQILGMRRRRVAAILSLETVLSSLGALAAGLALGIFASQFLVFVTAEIMGDAVADYHFVFSPRALVLTAAVFAGIFALTLALNLATLGRLQLTELMTAGSRTQSSRLARRPWLAAVVFAVGAVLIGVAYWRLHHYGYDVVGVSGVGASDAAERSREAGWGRFGLTTLMVVAGTYLVFFAFGGALLALAARSRHMYWRGLTMFTVRELGSRVRSSAASMATISLVMFLMLSIVTASFGVASALRTSLARFAPHGLTFTISTNNPELPASGALAALERWGATQTSQPASAGHPASGTFEGEQARWVAVREWTMLPFDFNGPGLGREIDVDPDGPYFAPKVDTFLEATGHENFTISGVRMNGTGVSSLPVVSLSEHNALRELAGERPWALPEGTYAMSFANPLEELRAVYAQTLAAGVEVNVFGAPLAPAGTAEEGWIDESAAAVRMNSPVGNNLGTIIVPDSVLADVPARAVERPGGGANPMTFTTTTVVDFDGELSDERVLEISDRLEELVRAANGIATVDVDEETGFSVQAASGDARSEETAGGAGSGIDLSVTETGEAEADSGEDWIAWNPTSPASLRAEVLAVTGIVTFIGVYLGLVLAMAAAMILAIKVLSGAAEAAPRYRRLRDLGCPDALASRSLAVQVGVVFALPLAFAVAHAFVAVREASSLISLLVPLSLTHSMLLAGGFVLAIFAVYYAVAFAAARTVVAPN